MSSSQKNHSQNTLQSYCLIGLCQRLSKLFSYLKSSPDQFNIKLISSSDRFNELSNIQTTNALTNKDFPFGFLTLENLSESIESGYNNKALSRHFFSVSLSKDSDLFYQLRIIPKQFDLSLSLLFNNYYDMLGCLGTLSFIEKDKSADFDLLFAGLKFSIQVSITDSFAVPIKENAVEEINYYELVVQCQLKGYLSQPIPIEKLPTKTKIKQIEINGYSVTYNKFKEIETASNEILISYVNGEEIIKEVINIEDYVYDNVSH